MLQNELLKRVMSHLSSLSIVVLVLAIYIQSDHQWINQYIPPNSKILTSFLLFMVVIFYEISAKNHKTVMNKVDVILRQMEVNRLIHSVNALYGRFEDSDDEWITHEYTIKELSELNDMRERLGVNSYTQGRLEFLMGRIKRL